jgi:transposase-like protein
MPSTSLLNLSSLIDDAKCYALVRQQRWPEGVRCPGCGSAAVIRHGRDDTQEQRQRYRCKACAARFDDLTGTVLAGHHQPLRVWVLCLYLMGCKGRTDRIPPGRQESVPRGRRTRAARPRTRG